MRAITDSDVLKIGKAKASNFISWTRISNHYPQTSILESFNNSFIRRIKNLGQFPTQHKDILGLATQVLTPIQIYGHQIAPVEKHLPLPTGKMRRTIRARPSQASSLFQLQLILDLYRDFLGLRNILQYLKPLEFQLVSRTLAVLAMARPAMYPSDPRV